MKRIVAFLISMLFITTSVFASGSIPQELYSYPNNYTSSHEVTISLDDNSDIRSLIAELAEDEVGAVLGIDFFNFLSALFENNSSIDVKVDISSDYKKIKASMTNSNVFSSVVSSNLNYTINSKGGLWLDMDITNEQSPKIDMIFLLPTSDKYRYINLAKLIPEENLPMLKTYISPNIIDKIKDKNAQLLSQNSTVEKIGNKYKVTMNNENVMAIFKAIMEFDPFGSGVTYADEFDMEMPMEDFKILGKDGITAVYTVNNGKISLTETKADISMKVSEIAKAMGEEWEFDAEGIINIKMSEKIEFSKIGSTEVSLPTLNDSNSISLNDIIDGMMEPEEDYYDSFEYPFRYVGVYSDILPQEDGNYYVPLRSILEDGYDDTVAISYEKGVVTASCEHFPEFETLTVKIGENKVYTDGTEQACGGIKLIDGVTYVDTRLFTDVFGWTLSGINHDVLENSFGISFRTFEY